MFVPCRPGPVGSVLLRPAPAESCWPSCCATTSGLQPVERRAGRSTIAMSWPPISLESSAGLDRRPHARLVGDVGGEEDLHLAGDLLDRLVGRVARVTERGPDPLGDVVEPVAPPLERRQQRLVRAVHLVGDAHALGLLELLVGLHAVARDRRLQILRGLAAALAEQLEELGADLLAGVARDGRDLAVVVLERVLLGRAAAALDHEDEQQQHNDQADRGDRLAYADGLGVGGDVPTRSAARPRCPGAGLVVLVEEGHVGAQV